MLKHYPKRFLMRLGIFLLFSYIILPAIISALTPHFGLERYPYVNFFSTPLFILSAIASFIISNKELRTHDYTQDLRQTFLFSSLSALLFILYLNLGSIIDRLYLAGFASQPFNYAAVYLTYFLIIGFAFLAAFNTAFVRKFHKSLLLIILSSALFYLLSFFLLLHWMWFSTISARSVFALLSRLSSQVLIDYTPTGPVLMFNGFLVTIGSPCSGIESLGMFLMLFIIFQSHLFGRVKRWKVCLLLALGLIGAFYANVIRILLLVILGSHYPSISFELFHNNLGWIVFFIYYTLFVYISHSVLVRRSRA